MYLNYRNLFTATTLQSPFTDTKGWQIRLLILLLKYINQGHLFKKLQPNMSKQSILIKVTKTAIFYCSTVIYHYELNAEENSLFGQRPGRLGFFVEELTYH